MTWGEPGAESGLELMGQLAAGDLTGREVVECFVDNCELQQNFALLESFRERGLGRHEMPVSRSRELLRGVHAISTLMLFATIPPAILGM